MILQVNHQEQLSGSNMIRGIKYLISFLFLIFLHSCENEFYDSEIPIDYEIYNQIGRQLAENGHYINYSRNCRYDSNSKNRNIDYKFYNQVMKIVNSYGKDTSIFDAKYLDVKILPDTIYSINKYFPKQKVKEKCINLVPKYFNTQKNVAIIKESDCKYYLSDYYYSKSNDESGTVQPRFPKIGFSRVQFDRNNHRGRIYVYYIAGNLLGKGDMVYFEKINGQWLITKIENKWIS